MSLEILFEIIGLILEGIAYGVYCVIFCLYLRLQFKKIDRWKSPLVYAAIVTFILCTAYFAVESAHILLSLSHPEAESPVGGLIATVNTLYICIDFISQGILIYRCWMMWRRPLIMVVPIILSLAFLAIALTTLILMIRSIGILTGTVETPSWFSSTVVSFFSISLAVNALVTGLIVFKILNIYRDFQEIKNSVVHTQGKGPRDPYPIVSMLVESGAIIFVGQLLQAILYKVDGNAFRLVSGIVVMLYGISMIIVLVRVQMGLSYDIETSRMVTSHSLRFAPFESNNQVINITQNDPNSGSEMKIVGDV